MGAQAAGREAAAGKVTLLTVGGVKPVPGVPAKSLDSMGQVELQEPLAELARDPKHFDHDLRFPPAGKIRGCGRRDRDQAVIVRPSFQAPRQTFSKW